MTNLIAQNIISYTTNTVATEQWYQQARGDFGPTTLVDNPAYHVIPTLRGYDVVYENAGVGLVVNPWVRAETMTLAVKIIWNTGTSLIPAFGLVREIDKNYWHDHVEHWLTVARALSRVRQLGWQVSPGVAYHSDDHKAGISVIHPVLATETIRIPRFAKHYLDSRTHRTMTAVANKLNGLEPATNYVPPQPSDASIISQIRHHASGERSPTHQPISPLHLDVPRHIVGKRRPVANDDDDR